MGNKLKSINELNVDQIEPRHLFNLEKGGELYRRTLGNPIDFHYSKNTLTTAVPLLKKIWLVASSPSGTNFSSPSKITVYKETKNYKGDLKLYKFTVKNAIERILDLDNLCEEQGIEKEYLKHYRSGEDEFKAEQEIFKLYGKELENKRIYGVKFRSREDCEGDCIGIYDTLPHILKSKQKVAQIITNSIKRFSNISQEKMPWFLKTYLSLLSLILLVINRNTLSEYVDYEEIANIETFDTIDDNHNYGFI